MRSFMMAVGSAAYLRASDAPVALPFPDVASAEKDLANDPEPVSAEPVEQAQGMEEAAPEVKVSGWTMPTLAPDNMVSSADQFKHPTQAMLKDWETAPKIDMFEAPTAAPVSAPVSAVEEAEKPLSAALPAVKSSIHAVNPYGKRDDDAELAAIQREAPDAYGIVKALMMKKQLGLPMPGQDASQHVKEAREEMTGNSQDSVGSSEHVHDMWSWKPANTADDMALAASGPGDVAAAPAPEEAAAPAAVEEVAEAPAPAAVEEVAEAPAVEAPAPAAAPAAANGVSLSSWLGTEPVKTVAEPVEAPATTTQYTGSGSSLMNKYAMDLS